MISWNKYFSAENLWLIVSKKKKTREMDQSNFTPCGLVGKKIFVPCCIHFFFCKLHSTVLYTSEEPLEIFLLYVNLAVDKKKMSTWDLTYRSLFCNKKKTITFFCLEKKWTVSIYTFVLVWGFLWTLIIDQFDDSRRGNDARKVANRWSVDLEWNKYLSC